MEDFKFILGEKVKVKSSGKEGRVKGQKLETYEYNNQPRETINYHVEFGFYNTAWFTADQLESLERYTFNDEFELGLRNFMIDIHLDKGEFDIIKELQQKKTYEIRRSL